MKRFPNIRPSILKIEDNILYLSDGIVSISLSMKLISLWPIKVSLSENDINKYGTRGIINPISNPMLITKCLKNFG